MSRFENNIMFFINIIVIQHQYSGYCCWLLCKFLVVASVIIKVNIKNHLIFQAQVQNKNISVCIFCKLI